MEYLSQANADGSSPEGYSAHCVRIQKAEIQCPLQLFRGEIACYFVARWTIGASLPLTSTLRSGRAIKATSMPPLATATEDGPALSLGERAGVRGNEPFFRPER